MFYSPPRTPKTSAFQNDPFTEVMRVRRGAILNRMFQNT